MIHLVCGPIGAGKTTLAHQLAKEHGAIRFSEDEWLKQLFVPDAPEGLMNEPAEVIATWAMDKYQRCRGQIWLVFQQLLQQGVPVVLDGAAANKTQRDLIRQKASDHGVGFQLHYVTADPEIRKARVLERNSVQGETYSLDVTESMIDLMEAFFEAPEDEELLNAHVIES